MIGIGPEARNLLAIDRPSSCGIETSRSTRSAAPSASAASSSAPPEHDSHRVADAAEKVGDEAADLRLVIDHQQAAGFGTGGRVLGLAPSEATFLWPGLDGSF